MGKQKKTTSNKVDPWIPDSGTFQHFKNMGGSLITNEFRDGLNRAQGTLNHAGGLLGQNGDLTNVMRDQAYNQNRKDGQFDATTHRVANAGLDPRFNEGVAAGMRGGRDGVFDQATRGAQSPQYAQGFQNTLMEMQDPSTRSAAFSQVKRNVADDVMKDVNATFSGSGMTGSSLHQQNLAKGLASGIASVENNAFQQSQARALQAAQVGQSDLQGQRQLGLSAANARQSAAENQASRQLQGAGMVQSAQSNLNSQALQAAQSRQGAYENSQNRAMQAASALNSAQGQQFARSLGLSQAQAGLGQQFQGAYQGAVQGLMGAATGGASRTTTQSQSPGFMGILGAGLQAASLFSDERLKTDKKKVGKLNDGTPIYTYRYKDGVAPEFEGKTLMGVMANQVKNKNALEEDPSGFKRVNYGAL